MMILHCFHLFSLLKPWDWDGQGKSQMSEESFFLGQCNRRAVSKSRRQTDNRASRESELGQLACFSSSSVEIRVNFYKVSLPKETVMLILVISHTQSSMPVMSLILSDLKKISKSSSTKG